MMNSKRMKWAGNVARIGVKRMQDIGRKVRRKEATEKIKLKVVDNINMHLRETGCRGMEWTDTSQDKGQWRAIVNILINFWVP
jgi:hypothetical protein